MYPEEKMANRVLAIRKLTPPFDLDQLARSYGELEYLDIPYGVDGITIGIGGGERPKILVNSSTSPTRQKFTLAHEIGHVVIPWHTGTIVSHAEDEPGESDNAYQLMEAEANRFAAELLMPSAWLASEFEKSQSVKEYFCRVLEQVGTSKEATFYKIFKSLSIPVVCANIDIFSQLVSLQRSISLNHVPARGERMDRFSFTADNKFEEFEIDGQYYMSWLFVGRQIEENDPRPWRDIFDEIMNSTNMNHKRQSVNAILASGAHKAKGQSVPDICGSVLRTFSDRHELSVIVSHPLFEQYIVKRVKELSARS